ncbi:Bug family tripartite tricarboxylate transporter substrate binding protein [Bordetella genomosp. 13]|uniref:Bug family tripartite tricarboxylate transporter substrate binding protein n=1 Tax=Bordetella genomosp. 13 TaxID=463040 RepID=UPI0016425B60|nr:tripartite tricarboxylate transporter substrate binding protein [Bordetella genomosp. 13]
MGLACLASAAHAQYPERPVTVIVPFAAGGASDIVARVIAQQLNDEYKQAFIVENKPGASTQIATRQVINSAPDGYTLLLATTSVVNNAYLYPNLNYDAARGLRPVIGLVDVPAFLVAGPTMPATTVPQFLAEARKRSEANKLSFGSAGTASTLHLAGEWFNQVGKLKGVHIPYKGSGPAVVALASGEVDYSFENLAPAQPQVSSKRIRLLAIAGPNRFPTLPDVPPLKDFGLPDTDMASWFVLLAPSGTPDAVVTRLNESINRILAKPDVKARLLDLGLVPSGGTPGQLADRMKADSDKWISIIKAGNVTVEQ